MTKTREDFHHLRHLSAWHRNAITDLLRLAARSVPVEDGGPTRVCRSVEEPSGGRSVASLDLGSLVHFKYGGTKRQGFAVHLQGKHYLVTRQGQVYRRAATHFMDRWTERGLPDVCDGRYLEVRLKKAMDGREDLRQQLELEFYPAAKKWTDQDVYRFVVDGQVFFCVFHRTGWPMTVFPTEYLPRLRVRMKRKRRGQSGPAPKERKPKR